MAIVLKSAYRRSSVPRSSIRDAVAAVYSGLMATGPSGLRPQTATITKRAAAKKIK